MSTTQPRGPFARRGFIAAVVVVGIIVLAAIIVIATSIARDSSSRVAAPTATPTAPAASASEKSICGLPGFETRSSLTVAPTNKWVLIGTVAAPDDPKGAGPGLDKGGFRSCYAHTAEGALFAAVNFVALSSDSRNSSKMYELIAAGKARDAAKAAAGTPSTPSSSRAQVAGFKIDSYSATEATVDVAWSVTSNGGTLVSDPTVLLWQDGDWKIVITPSGAPIAPGSLTDLGGYIPWSGV